MSNIRSTVLVGSIDLFVVWLLQRGSTSMRFLVHCFVKRKNKTSNVVSKQQYLACSIDKSIVFPTIANEVSDLGVS